MTKAREHTPAQSRIRRKLERVACTALEPMGIPARQLTLSPLQIEMIARQHFFNLSGIQHGSAILAGGVPGEIPTILKELHQAKETIPNAAPGQELNQSTKEQSHESTRPSDHPNRQQQAYHNA
jgi:hypothetical protein